MVWWFVDGRGGKEKLFVESGRSRGRKVKAEEGKSCGVLDVLERASGGWSKGERAEVKAKQKQR